MSRVVTIIDPDTGKLVDATGRDRETGRYAKFAKRMLSTAQNPVLDYGGNGGDTLFISKNGAAGKAVNIMADTVNVLGELKVDGQTVQEMAEVGVESVLGRVVGTPGQIQVVSDSESSSGDTVARVSLDPNFAEDVRELGEAVDNCVEKVPGKGLSAEDFTTELKQKLEGIEAQANKYVLPPATVQTIGGVKQGQNVTIAADGTISATATAEGKLDAAVEDVYEFSWGDFGGDGLRLDIDGGEGEVAAYIFPPPGAITEYGVARIRDLYYAIGLATPVEEGTQQMYDRAMNLVDGADLPSVLALPDKDWQEQGARARDLYVRVDMTGKSSTSWSPAVMDTHTGEAAACETEDGTFPALVGGKINLYHFMETEDGVFAILHKTLTRMPQAGGA